MSDQVPRTEQRVCRFPGCDRPAAAGDAGTGRPPEYCDDAGHNRASAWRERQRRKEAGPAAGRGAADEARPVEAARQRASELVAQLTGMAELFLAQLPRAVEEIRTAGDLDAAEAQIETVTTEAEERIAAAAARASRAEQAQRRAEAEREEADAAAVESAEAVARLEGELAEVAAHADELRSETNSLREELATARESAAAAAATSAIAALRDEAASLQTRLEERTSVLEGERDQLAEQLDTAQAARAEAEERARGAVERATTETARADRAEQAAAAARDQVDHARGSEPPMPPSAPSVTPLARRSNANAATASSGSPTCAPACRSRSSGCAAISPVPARGRASPGPSRRGRADKRARPHRPCGPSCSWGSPSGHRHAVVCRLAQSS